MRMLERLKLFCGRTKKQGASPYPCGYSISESALVFAKAARFGFQFHFRIGRLCFWSAFQFASGGQRNEFHLAAAAGADPFRGWCFVRSIRLEVTCFSIVEERQGEDFGSDAFAQIAIFDRNKRFDPP